MSEERTERRVCIMGTAPTWKDIPWDDPTLEIWALNDAHVLNPRRVDRWFDLHPFDKMFFANKQKKILAHQVPAGYFVRPEGHIEWLRRQTIPVYVQDATQLGSPSAVTFPREEIEKRLGPNFASSPAWMVGLALIEGVTELHIYGIHLATEWEYLKQKPNLLFLLGLAAGRGVKIVLPKGSPLLAETHRYAYDVDPDVAKVSVQRRMSGLQQQKALLEKQVASRKWYSRPDPNLQTRLSWLDAQLMDAQLDLQCVIAGRAPAGEGNA